MIQLTNSLMSKLENYADKEGNSIMIEEGKDGISVSANIKTKPQYTGGANAVSARNYAKRNKLEKK